MIVVIDNYDSFTYNLVQYLGELGAELRVFRNDKITLEEIERQAVTEALKMSNWIQKDAAELLGISPRVMNYKIKILSIEIPRSRRQMSVAV